MNSNSTLPLTHSVRDDLVAGLVVFVVALPFSLGIALASNAPLFSGLLAGAIGGIVIGFLSGSQTSVSGTAAGSTAVIGAQILQLGSFEAFLVALVIAGVLQVIMSIAKLGFIAAFFPSSVIKGLLAAIGITIILKQIPHLLGHDLDPIGNNTFLQANNKNTLSEIVEAYYDISPGPALIGVISLVILILWDFISSLRNSSIPAPLVVIIFGVIGSLFLQTQEGYWGIELGHLVQVPIAKTAGEFFNFFIFPDYSALTNSAVYVAGFTVAVVISLETLLNVEAVDKIDPLQRYSPPNRELMAQGFGNILAGLIGGIPITSGIVRSSVNINAGSRSKLSTIWHGCLILLSVVFIPKYLNQIPLAALAAILFMTGLRLVTPQLIKQMWDEGKNQFLPFAITILAVVFTDILVGVLIGLAISICFILYSNLRRPIKKIMEKHASGDDVLHIELPNQVGFFDRASLSKTLHEVPYKGHVLIDAHNTDYIDPDILDLITDFQNNTAKAQKVSLSFVGFKDKYPRLEDKILFMDFSSYESRETLTPEKVLHILEEGNARFRKGIRVTRDLDRQLNATATGQFPIAVVLSCIDSRSPAELIFDLSLGDIFSVRIGGNIVSRKVLGSIEFGCAVAGAKVVLVMGHTSCGAVKASVDLICEHTTANEATGCVNLGFLTSDIQESVDLASCYNLHKLNEKEKKEYYDDVAYKNVIRTMKKMREESATLDELVRHDKIAIIGAMYNIHTAKVTFFQENGDFIRSSDLLTTSPTKNSI